MIVDVPMMMTGQVLSGAAVVVGVGPVVAGAPSTITAPPEDATDITCPLSVNTAPGPRVCPPMTTSVDDMTETVWPPIITGGRVVVTALAVSVSAGPVALAVTVGCPSRVVGGGGGDPGPVGSEIPGSVGVWSGFEGSVIPGSEIPGIEIPGIDIPGIEIPGIEIGGGVGRVIVGKVTGVWV